MFSPTEVLLFGLLFGVGYNTGYYLVGTIYSWIVVTVKKYRLSRSMKAAEKRQKEEGQQGPQAKLCLKCKKNPRPPTGIYCASCQFMGGEKF